ncbi:hypothetical protein Taro_000894 [Colocasia esculenta]|uniref:Uncharacterized protein n=1 Tax=Colocasia esculenta TaxID=4460 RepID=A0A843TGJ5_COLES|nr:hypothetical protein [Colocasia esculenta]
MWTFVIELDGKRSGRQPIGGSHRRRDVESVTVCTRIELPCFCFCLSPGHRVTLCLDDRRVGVLRRTRAPRKRPREGVAEQVTHQEAGDAPPPQQT